MGISQDVIDTDLALQEQVTRGERAAESLGHLRYRACIDGGATYVEYAAAVEVSPQAVRESVERYANNKGLVIPAFQRGRPRLSAFERETRTRAALAEQETARRAANIARQAPAPAASEDINLTLAWAVQLSAMSKALVSKERPSQEVVDEIKAIATETITQLQALLAHLEGS